MWHWSKKHPFSEPLIKDKLEKPGTLGNVRMTKTTVNIERSIHGSASNGK